MFLFHVKPFLIRQGPIEVAQSGSMRHVARLIKVHRGGPDPRTPLQLLRSAGRQIPGTKASVNPHCCSVALADRGKRGVHTKRDASGQDTVPEHNARGAKRGPRGKLGHAAHGTCARGPNADVMFVYVWSSYISWGYSIPANPPLRFHHRTVDHDFRLARRTNSSNTPVDVNLSFPVDAYLFPPQHV